MKKEIIYLVMSSRGSWDDYFEYAIFATKDKEYAETYIDRLNTLIDNKTKILEPYIQNGVIKREYFDSWQYSLWEKVGELNESFLREVEIR